MDLVKYINVNKSFKQKSVLKEFNLSIPKNSILFLLGLNGAGKTTLLKLTIGLLNKNSGEIINNSNKISAIIETPTFYENLTGFQNLKYHAILTGTSDEEINNALSDVSLDHSDKRAVKKYSLGMKQRLGLARAILSNAPLLLLDEPFIGLDPAGVHDIKEIIRKLNQERNVTILLSSHLIKETEALATHYAILHNGSIVSTFDNTDFNEILTCIYLETNNFWQDDYINKLSAIFENLSFFKVGGGFEIFSFDKDKQQLEKVYTYIREHFDNALKSSSISKGTLDDYFLAVTSGGICK